MESFEGGHAESSASKCKAVEDARKMQASLVKDCNDAGQDPPPYVLSELIGKGSFGRVYKADATNTAQVVAVKLINIDQGDSLDSGAADTFGDILKEVSTLKLLGQSGAKNINTIIDTFLVGHSICIVMEHCAGGSVSTLMRPTKGLAEKWIIPVLREVAEAVYWVHKQGIIHRDIKCANVLLTEAGRVQLCDFGVAAILETKFDKRRTITGTLQWMAPELFDLSVSYGTEVDIWSFGSMAFEIASGLPPNAAARIEVPSFGSYLKQNCPRLEGDQFSAQLKHLVSYCMVQEPALRPSIQQVQAHPYIANTSDQYPTTSLAELVKAYRSWEAQGGSRQSLFNVGGAKAKEPKNGCSSPPDGEAWNFNTTDALHEPARNGQDAGTVHGVYGPRINLCPPQPRRRQPHNMKPFKSPIEKVFDPNTISNYGDDARAFYNREQPAITRDLPLRDNSKDTDVRESLIDLDVALDGSKLSRFVDMDTIKPKPRKPRPRLSETVASTNRRTLDWTFPMMAPSARADTPNTESNAGHSPNASAQHATKEDRSSRTATNKPETHQSISNSQTNRVSTVSLIDLDDAEISGPSTAGSDAPSSASPFELERYAAVCRILLSPNKPHTCTPPDGNVSDPPPQAESCDPQYSSSTHSTTGPQVSKTPSKLDASAMHPTTLPPPPPPLPANVMLGLSSSEEVEEELRGMILSLRDHLQAAAGVLETLAARRPDN